LGTPLPKPDVDSFEPDAGVDTSEPDIAEPDSGPDATPDIEPDSPPTPTCPNPPVAPIYLELTWDTPGADLDLHLVHPFASGLDIDGDGTDDGWFDSTFDCSWVNEHPTWISGGPRFTESLDGSCPETIKWDNPSPNEGLTFKVGIHYWDDLDQGSATPTLRIYINQELRLEVDDVQLNEGDFFEVATIDWPSGTVTALSGDQVWPDTYPIQGVK